MTAIKKWSTMVSEERAKVPRHEVWTHLPAPPWKYCGYTHEVYVACPGAPVMVGGSCDHCGTGIKDTFHFESINTETSFKVGSTCVNKMLKEMKTKSLTAASVEIKKIKNAAARERAAAKRERDKKAAGELLEAHRAAAAEIPHPLKWAADGGRTLADWAEWMIRNGGGKAHATVVARFTKEFEK